MDTDRRITTRCHTLLLLAVVLWLAPCVASAQRSDFGIWYSAGATGKINKQWSVALDGEFRTRNDARTADRWSLGVGATYRWSKHLKVAAGYTFLYDNNHEKVTSHTDATYNSWTPSYWGTRHRLSLSLTGSVGWGRLSFSLRERWQYTYRPATTTRRWDFDQSQWEDRSVRGKGKNVLRSRLEVEYDIPKSHFQPYVQAELFNAWSVEKSRLTIGTAYKLSKRYSVQVCYRYQSVRHGDDGDDADRHVLGVGCQVKF